MKPEEKIEGDGKKVLAHNRAVEMVVRGYGDKDIQLVGVILAAKGVYALDMRDTAPMGIPDPDGDKYHRDDWGSNDGVTKKKSGHRVTALGAYLQG
jgi:hypothetical protein